MPAYLIFDLKIFDLDAFSAYADEARALMSEYGGTVVVNGRVVDVLEGDWYPSSLVVARFDDMPAARAFYECEPYQRLLRARPECAVSAGVLVEHGILKRTG